jgi:hypothetical protein
MRSTANFRSTVSRCLRGADRLELLAASINATPAPLAHCVSSPFLVDSTAGEQLGDQVRKNYELEKLIPR